MDNHGSHETGEFVQLANLNHILPYPFLAHASHYMQPCDVGLFQPYKHRQSIKLNEAIAQLDVEYHLKSTAQRSEAGQLVGDLPDELADWERAHVPSFRKRITPQSATTRYTTRRC
jgi:hypothetical protein